MLNRPRSGIVRSMLVQGTLAALLGMTLGCGKSSPAGPTPTPVTPAPVAPAPLPVTLEGISLTASPNSVTAGGQLTMSWVAPAGLRHTLCTRVSGIRRRGRRVLGSSIASRLTSLPRSGYPITGGDDY
jgi:hypothetical protein